VAKLTDILLKRISIAMRSVTGVVVVMQVVVFILMMNKPMQGSDEVTSRYSNSTTKPS
jgi:hypothetical protein